MNRLLLLFLLVLMPLQLVWAAAAPYCAHEPSTTQAKHLGHHAHEHESGDAPAVAADDGAAPASIDTDCASCHLASSATLPAATSGFVVLPRGALPGGPARAYRSHVPSGPERPDRFELTAAARFGGGAEFSLHLA